MRPTYLIAFCGLLVLLLGILVAPIRELEVPGSFRSTKEGQSLSIQELSDDEMVVIVYRSYGWKGTSDSLYQISGGPIAQFMAKSSSPDEEEKTAVAVMHDSLTDTERVGLDSYLLYLRHGPLGSVHRQADIIVGYYRDGIKLGEERFRDDSGVLYEITIKDGVLHGPEDDWRRPESFPPSVYREIIHPAAIERKLKEANQPVEATATAAPRRQPRLT